ncbi:hypothetical protein PybrP1_005652 [[Pythium] brassicae (nom. inval.)]|nr:hypothetical protein PybrP1_005652 [[Pythium] brassicae (nom. inval.)]
MITTNAKKLLLTTATITEATGESDHAQLDDIEIIFGAFEEVHALALRQCRALQRLTRTLINCRLTCISGLDSVGASLLHLSLSGQQITHIEGLSALVHLRSLCLQQNRIETIEGLQSCRKLQKLWLYGNRITRVENLAACSDLRELWLQDNKIQTLNCDGSGISTLANLQSLHLANNRIRNIDELQNLRTLVHLRDLSFSDEHFGSNPIVSHPDYRSYTLGTLDRLAIDRSERQEADDQFLMQALEFNDTLAGLTLACENELRSVHARRERGLSNAQMLQQELVEALNELEQCVADGHEQIQSEKQRQQRLRDENTRILDENVETIKKRFSTMLETLMEQETHTLGNEELMCEYLEQEALAEHRLVSAITALQSANPSMLAFQILPDHSLDHRYIASHFHSRKHDQSGTRDDEDHKTDRCRGNAPVELLQIIRFFHHELVSAFENSMAAHRADPGEGAELYLYLVTIELFYPDKRNLDSLQALHAVATPKGSILQPPPLAFLQLELGRSTEARGGGGHVYMIRKAKVGSNVLPQFVLLVSRRFPLPPGEGPEDASEILARFQRTLDAEVTAFHARLLDEVDPAQVRFRSQFLEQKRSLDEQLRQQRVQIENEKKLQEQLVRSLPFEQQATRRR